MTLGRREFLQWSGAALAALGGTDMALAGLAQTYQTAIADASRCLALLIGINRYPAETWQSDTGDGDSTPALLGALTDIELQRELLISRFGIAPTDIVALTNEDATVNRILETLQQHVLDQAQPGDTVLLHFSGLGSKVHLVGRPQTEYLPTLVTADSAVPNADVPVVQDLFEESLAQLLGTLKGVKVLTTIDASAQAPATLMKGNFRVRSRPFALTGTWQEPFDARLKTPNQPAQKLVKNWPGFLLRASQENAPALEGSWDGFSAGLFTYALTQQIWMSLPAQKQLWFIHRIDRKMSAWTGTDKSPQLLGQLASSRDNGLPLLSGRLPKPAANGVIKAVDAASKHADIWLGGLPSGLLPYADLGLQLRPLPTLPNLAATPQGMLTVRSLDGLTAKTNITTGQDLVSGTPLVEVQRHLPREIDLTVALDTALERIERVDATSALSGLSYIDTIALGENQADCIFAQYGNTSLTTEMTGGQAADDAVDSDVSPLGYALFTPDRSLIAGTSTEEAEAVKTAVSRLSGPFRNLLAVKMLRLTENPVSSQLPVRLSLETRDAKSQLLLVEETLRSRQVAGSPIEKAGKLTFGQVSSDRGEQYELQVLNAGQTPLYYLIVSVVEKIRLSVYCPPVLLADGVEQTSRVIAEASKLPPGTAIQCPEMENSAFSLPPLQTTEIFAVCSTLPFVETWRAIRTPEFRQISDRWSMIPAPLKATQAIFTDLDKASQTVTKSAAGEGLIVLHTDAWATLSL